MQEEIKKYTKFNKNIKTHEGAKAPLFLGPELGIIDTINTQYPVLEELYQLQLAQIWNEFEVDLTQDKVDMQTLPKSVTDLMVKTIMWQTVADSVASRSIIETLGKYISNSELMNLATLWSFFEVIHARTYSHIIKQTFTDPNELLEELYNDAAIMQRSEVIVDCFDNIANLSNDAPREEVEDAIIQAFTGLFALEAIAFMSSFAVTFAIVRRDVLIGIGQLVTLICRDEVLHTRMDYEILSILMNDPDISDMFKRNEGKIKEILDAVVQQEINSSEYLFSEGREVIGLNAKRLQQYSLFVSKPVYDVLGIPFDFEVVEENPLPYMDDYTTQGTTQAAAQEVQIVNYQIGAIADDTDDIDFDDMEF